MAPSALIAAVDLGPQTARVLYHAAGLARLGPYHADFAPDDVVARARRVSEIIAREAERERAGLVVMGSRGHHGVAPLLLGSTSEAGLRAATESAGLVVMGLCASPKCQPGSIASAVLKTKTAFVLAVPAADGGTP